MTLFNRTMGSSSSPTIRRQGNYVYVDVRQTITISISELAQYVQGQRSIIQLPSGYTPAITTDNILVWLHLQNSSTLAQGRVFNVKLTAGSSSSTYVDQIIDDNTADSATYIVVCNFGYRAQPR